jgi:putative transposase
MSELRKSNTDHPYFLTLTVVGWIDVFTRKIYNDKIIESLMFCVNHKGLEIFAYVIMPSHVHLVVRSLAGNLPGIIRDFKSFTAKEIIKLIENEPGESRREWLLYMFKFHARNYKRNKQYIFWQKTNHSIELSYPEIMNQKIEYIHNNPVEAGYVTEPEKWNYSSVNELSALKVLQV